MPLFQLQRSGPHREAMFEGEAGRILMDHRAQSFGCKCGEATRRSEQTDHRVRRRRSAYRGRKNYVTSLYK